MPTIDLREGTVFYEEQGAGPILLLIHGFPLDHTMWRGQLAGLSDAYRIIAIDLPGFGQSFVPTGAVTIERLADWVAEFLAAIYITETVTVAGLSMGGCVAFQFALRHATKLRGLILCDCRAVTDLPDVQKTRHEAAERALREGPGFLAEAMPARLFSAHSREQQPEMVAAIQQVIRNAPPIGVAGGSWALANRVDVSGRLSEIGCPTLLIVGTEDIISPVAEMQLIADGLPNGHLVEIAGAGHMAPLESPDLVNAAICEWLLSHP